ncbi:uncharacterized protein RSE6_01928 [Rhynchosporium secalis]|uniref:C2H2-type domain-containing protein n=1 Tax=Rhynchosporium secalis TaxID=38038 RepID=A0A1E1LZ10_RHYSE|nr:uncharacterized protein RSE6_01928 [Rhynchosporium secalis]
MDHRCFDCEAGFASFQAVSSHCRAKRHRAGVECDDPDCEDLFIDEDTAQVHYDKEHRIWCYSCDETFSSADELDCHDRVYHNFPCYTCDKMFRSDAALDQHNDAKHHNYCGDCVEWFFSEASWSTHLDTAHSFVCPECPERSSYRTASALQAHQDSPAHSFECGKCERKFRTTQGLTRHINSAHFVCSKCNVHFGTGAELTDHTTITHVFACNSCDMKFDTTSKRNAHVSSAHVMKCNLCKETFKTEETRRVHIDTKHKFPCTGCSLVFGSTEELAKHVSDKHVFCCEHCPKSFFSQQLLEAHISTSHKIICKKCFKTFASHKNHAEHLEKEHVIPCKICKEILSSAEDLLKHTAVRHGYSCCSCVESFATKLELTAHRTNTHGIECHECDQRFMSPSTFAKHFMEAHMHKCTICKAYFDNKDTFKEHTASAHENKPALICGLCKDGVFPNIAALEKHTAELHSAQSEPDSIFYESFEGFSPEKESEISKQDGLPNQENLSPNGTQNSKPASHTKEPFEIKYPPMLKEPLPPQCMSCPNKLFLSQATLEKHFIESHADNIKQSCHLCYNLNFDSSSARLKHHADDHSFKCPYCVAQFERSHLLVSHIDDSHTYRCTYTRCGGLPFTSAKEMDKHIKTHEMLDKGITEKENKLTHISHNESGPATATTKPSTSSCSPPNCKACLTYHTHHGTIYSCKECEGADFLSPEDLNRHIKHSPFHGKPKYDCTECLMEFADQIKLLLHIESKPHKTKWVLSML